MLGPRCIRIVCLKSSIVWCTSFTQKTKTTDWKLLTTMNLWIFSKNLLQTSSLTPWKRGTISSVKVLTKITLDKIIALTTSPSHSVKPMKTWKKTSRPMKKTGFGATCTGTSTQIYLGLKRPWNFCSTARLARLAILTHLVWARPVLEKLLKVVNLLVLM